VKISITVRIIDKSFLKRSEDSVLIVLYLSRLIKAVDIADSRKQASDCGKHKRQGSICFAAFLYPNPYERGARAESIAFIFIRILARVIALFARN